MRPVLEFVDLPLPNHPVARSKLTARLLLLEKILSALSPPLLALVWVVDCCWLCGPVGVPRLFLLLLLFWFECLLCSRRHRSRPKIRSIRLEVVKCINSSLFFALLTVDGAPTISVVSASLLSPSPAPLFWPESIVFSLIADVAMGPPPLIAIASICLVLADWNRFTVAVLVGVPISIGSIELPQVVGLTVAISMAIAAFTAADLGAMATTIGGVALRAGSSGTFDVVFAADVTLPTTDVFFELILISGDA